MDGSFKADVKVFILKRFYNETSARLYQSRLKNEGVESFLSNSIASTLLPFSEGGFILHVREEDLPAATEILGHIEHDLGQISKGDFKDADLQDIYYEREVWAYDQKLKNSSPVYAFMILLVAFAMLLAHALFKKEFWNILDF